MTTIRRTQADALVEFSDWVLEVVEWAPEDANLPGGLDSINLTINRKRIAEFLERFSSDSDVQDFLLLDVLGVEMGAEISSTGEVEVVPDLSIRPFRLWEYIWLYKTLQLAEGGKTVLDLGGPASHIVLAAALAGNQVQTRDLNPRIVEAGRQCAKSFRLESYRAEVGDMRDLSGIPSNSVDRIVCCSVLEHLTADDQKRALSEMARVLAPGGVIGLTFDYGAPAPGVNIYLPPPHDPPETADQVRDRYVHSGLETLEGFTLEDPVPGSLFRTADVSYTIAALFLGKPPLRQPPAPILVHRALSGIPYFQAPDVIFRLQKKARRDLSHLAGTQALRRAAEERLGALENADAELHRLYPELERREALLAAARLSRTPAERRADFKLIAEERLQALDAAHSELTRLYHELELRRQKLLEVQDYCRDLQRSAAENAASLQLAAQDRLQALEAAHAELSQLYAEMKRREDALMEVHTQAQEYVTQIEQAQLAANDLRSELQAREAMISDQESHKGSLESEIGRLRNELSNLRREVNALRSEKLLEYLRRRWMRRS